MMRIHWIVAIVVIQLVYLANCAKSRTTTTTTQATNEIASSTYGKRINGLKGRSTTADQANRGGDNTVWLLNAVEPGAVNLNFLLPTPSTRTRTDSRRIEKSQRNLPQSSSSSAKPSTIRPRKRQPTTRAPAPPNIPAVDSLLRFEFPTPAPSTTTTAKPSKRKPIFKSRNSKELTCPKEKHRSFQWFPLPCDRNKDCALMGKNYRCCEYGGHKICEKGTLKPIPEPKHAPVFGIPVKCPKLPMAELFFNVQTCVKDEDCWPRVCCPDGRKKYCRAANPEFSASKSVFAKQFETPYKTVSSYIQCTPPSTYDANPITCNNSLDCFPNICCQEGGKKHCRPAKRSIFSAIASTVSDQIQRSIFRT